MSLSIFTSMTNPDQRNDPWKEALECYDHFADEVVVVGEDWPDVFSWEHIGETFQKGYDKCTSDWVIRMDVDYFFHENDLNRLRKALVRFNNYPVIAFPQYQFFTPDRYQIKTRICLAFNKKKFNNIRLNGGGDLTLATINDELIDPKKVPNVNIPIYQYESIFRTKEIIRQDRARFATAWLNFFGEVGDRGGSRPEEAYEAWYEMVKDRYPKHNFKISLDDHPKFIKEKIRDIPKNQFGNNAFGLKNTQKVKPIYHLKGLREKYYNPLFLYIYRYKNYYNR